MSAVPFSYRQYAGNGSTTSFSVPFPYLLKSHVKVYIGFNILDGTYSSELADGTGFTWSSGTQIQCTTAPASGQTLTVIRVTPNTTRLVDWQDGSNLISNDLDTADLQNLYVIQEQQDRNDAGITQSTNAQTAATAATAASSTATTTANTALSTANTALSTANTASSNASAAVTTANTASTDASAAVATANTASTNASAAVATSNTASTNASSAVTTANSAVTTANSAVTTANSAVTTANNANTTAQAANTTATNAESIANSALSIVAGTVQFVPVANVAAIPASPSNDDAIQVQDSTGIQSFTPLTGLPSGFLGTPQLFVRLQYDTPGSTWQYVGYGANDPDNRYVVQGVTGTANNPSFYFDPDTGIYSPGANELGLSTGGAARLTIDSAGNVAIPGTLGVTGAITGSLTGSASLNVLKAGDTMTGSLTAPALIPSGSTVPTNGVYLPAANSVAISTNGTGRLFVGSDGKVTVNHQSFASPIDSPLAVAFGAGASIGCFRFSDNISGPSLRLSKSRSGTIGTNTLVSNGDTLGSIEFYGADGSTYYVGARIQSSADTPSLGAMPGTLIFSTTPSASTSPTERLRITSSGLVGIGTSSVDANSKAHIFDSSLSRQLLVQGDANDAAITVNKSGQSFTFGIDASDGNKFKINTGNTVGASDHITIDTSGRLGIGSSSATHKLTIDSSTDADLLFIRSTASANNTSLRFGISGNDSEIHASGGSSGNLAFKVFGNERARIDNSGRLLIGTSSYSGGTRAVFRGNTAAAGTQGVIVLQRDGANPSTTQGLGEIRFVDSNDGWGASISAEGDATWSSPSDCPTRLVFSTTADGASSPTERMRISQNGRIGIGKDGGSIVVSTAGILLDPVGTGYFTRAGNIGLYVNRETDDGSLVEFAQAGTTEGTISVSGTTVSYNGAHLSRWSQLPSGAERTEILRGSVLSNIDEMCEWGEEDNEQLNRMKVSDIEGDKNVSGVFQAWDDDDDTYTNDFYCAMTGDFIIRIGAGVTVERGDLLMSAGDGTAKPQDDDIIRSKTIAKVTSTNVTCTYDDGSYCVPCVLMAC